MSVAHGVKTEEANILLEGLTTEERDYMLFRLVSEKVDGERPLAAIPVHRPDGTLLAHIQPSFPPSIEVAAIMNERAKRVNPGAGRATRELVDRMLAGDSDGVKKFIR